MGGEGEILDIRVDDIKTAAPTFTAYQLSGGAAGTQDTHYRLVTDTLRAARRSVTAAPRIFP
jgi:hypothetical protein